MEALYNWRWGIEYFRGVRPLVLRALSKWHDRANAIPDGLLREHALSSLTTKQFHCEGGGVFASPSRDPNGHLMSFLVAYQTLCDYLDTVTDRGPSLDRTNFRTLHQSLLDAVTPMAPLHDYYQHHPHREDGGYMKALVVHCQETLAHFPSYPAVQDQVQHLAKLYVDLQVLKHGPLADRVPDLTQWYVEEGGPATGLAWWEFAAATGSTLGIFALLGDALVPNAKASRMDDLYRLYFPWMGSLHILLDYFIDQAEDLAGGDLNFVTYYPDVDSATHGIQKIYKSVMLHSRSLPDGAFHRYVARGLLGFYLSDRKARAPRLSRPSWTLLNAGGPVSVGIWLAARVGRAP